MTIGHLKKKRQFKPNGNIPGGSKKGGKRPQWPWFIKMVAESVAVQWAGSRDAMLDDRTGMPEAQLWEALCHLLPGLHDWCLENRANGPEEWPDNIHNRVYKMYYSGSSDRGKGHDPKTRAIMSDEHWKPRVECDHPWLGVSEGIIRGTVRVLPDWKSELHVKLKPVKRNGK